MSQGSAQRGRSAGVVGGDNISGVDIGNVSDMKLTSNLGTPNLYGNASGPGGSALNLTGLAGGGSALASPNVNDVQRREKMERISSMQNSFLNR